MNILYLSAYDSPKGQSARTYLFVKELVQMGHNVAFITNGFNHFSRKEYLKKNEWYRLETIDGIEVIWLKTYPYKTSGLDRIFNMLTNALMAYYHSSKISFRPNVVIGPSVPPLTGLSAYYIAKKYQSKFIYEIRDPWPEILIEMGKLNKSSISSKIIKIISKFLYKKSDYIISSLSNIYPILNNYNISTDKLFFLPNPVSISQHRKYNPINEEFIVTYLGGYGFGQDILTMLRAASLINNYNIYFKFVGVPIDLLDKYKKKYGSNNVTFYPVVDKLEAHDILIESSLLISAHKNDGSFKYGINSNKLHDYLASGKPIVFAANAPNNPVEISKAGICIPPESPELMAKAILTIFNLSEKERKLMGDKGIKYAKDNLDINLLGKKLDNILKKVLNL